jgi:hypothetical protein
MTQFNTGQAYWWEARGGLIHPLHPSRTQQRAQLQFSSTIVWCLWLPPLLVSYIQVEAIFLRNTWLVSEQLFVRLVREIAPDRDIFLLSGLSPSAKYTDRATAACRHESVPALGDRGCRVVSALICFSSNSFCVINVCNYYKFTKQIRICKVINFRWSRCLSEITELIWNSVWWDYTKFAEHF